MPLWTALIIAAVATLGFDFSLRALHDRKVARHQARLDDRMAAGQDRYFEELRELEAYDPRKRRPWQNITLELTRMLAFFAIVVTFLVELKL